LGRALATRCLKTGSDRSAIIKCRHPRALVLRPLRGALQSEDDGSGNRRTYFVQAKFVAPAQADLAVPDELAPAPSTRGTSTSERRGRRARFRPSP
jgi:hypothetical protein